MVGAIECVFVFLAVEPFWVSGTGPESFTVADLPIPVTVIEGFLLVAGVSSFSKL